MGTSYVEFRGRGFWTRDSFLSDWLKALVNRIRTKGPAPSWVHPVIGKWEVQIEIDGGCMNLDLDSLLGDDEKRSCIVAISEACIEQTPESAKRTGQLFIALLREEIETDASSPIDYL